MGYLNDYCGIYAIVHIPSKRRYIGQAQSIRNRWSTHVTQLSRNQHHCSYLQRCWNKYGRREFTFVILEECVVEKLNEREQHYMDKLPKELKFNLQPIAGSCRGFKVSEETKERMSQAAIKLASDPAERKRRSERAKEMHRNGRITYHPLKTENSRICKHCCSEFLIKRSTSGSWKQTKICPSCAANYKGYRRQPWINDI